MRETTAPAGEGGGSCCGAHAGHSAATGRRAMQNQRLIPGSGGWDRRDLRSGISTGRGANTALEAGRRRQRGAGDSWCGSRVELGTVKRSRRGAGRGSGSLGTGRGAQMQTGTRGLRPARDRGPRTTAGLPLCEMWALGAWPVPGKGREQSRATWASRCPSAREQTPLALSSCTGAGVATTGTLQIWGVHSGSCCHLGSGSHDRGLSLLEGFQLVVTEEPRNIRRHPQTGAREGTVRASRSSACPLWVLCHVLHSGRGHRSPLYGPFPLTVKIRKTCFPPGRGTRKHLPGAGDVRSFSLDFCHTSSMNLKYIVLKSNVSDYGKYILSVLFSDSHNVPS